MRKKTENEIKQLLQDSELIVRQALNSYADYNNFITGALGALLHQGIITTETVEFLENNLRYMETQSKKIEIEYYKLKNKMEE